MDLMTGIGDLPLIAILRGVEPDAVVDIGEVLYDCGFRCIEVPLNSPRPLDSIARLADRFAGRAIIGAGTVLSTASVEDVRAAGGRIIVSPNADAAVIGAAKAAGLYSLPAFQTPTEAFTAIAAGADAIKLFPAEAAPPAVLKAMRAVLPAGFPVFVVGGIDAAAMPAYSRAGASGFGIGSTVFAPGRELDDIRVRGMEMARAWLAQK